MNTNEKKPKLRTFLRWPGNKSKHINKIMPYLPDPDEYDRYVEPFLGSGSMFLALQPNKFIINDLNKDCINCWKAVRDDPKYIIKEFKSFGKKFKPLSKKDKVEWCREITADIEDQPYDIDRAVDLMLMKYCVYMGILKTNDKLYFNGLELNIYKNNLTFEKERYSYNINNVSKKLKNKNIYNTDYKKILKKTKNGDFVFLDPPYIEEHDYKFKYNKNEKLDNTFLNELKKELKKLDKKGVLWCMTQADTKQIRKLFNEYDINVYPVYRASSDRHKNELLLRNY